MRRSNAMTEQYHAVTHSGFSLIELLAVIGIIAILLALGIPRVHHFLVQTEDDILQKQLVDAIVLAKREAMVRDTPVSVRLGEANQLLISLVEGQSLSVESLSSHGSLHCRTWPHHRQYLLFSPDMEDDNGSLWHCHASMPVFAVTVSQSGRTRIILPDEQDQLKDAAGNSYQCE